MNTGLTAKNKGRQNGLTLVETLVGATIFALISISVWQGFTQTLQAVSFLRAKNTVTTLANEMFEVVRNMPYEDVGIVDGLPLGKIPKTQTVNRDGKDFLVTASVVNVDDPFDGVVGGSPNDLSPADNKIVEFLIECDSCFDFKPTAFTSKVAPRNLEITEDAGALFVQVIDADGDPIQGADVEIQNDDADPAFVVQETTNNVGMFQLVGAPPGSETYQITATKDGYTTDKTYTAGAPENPVPNKPHSNVSVGQVTQVTFAIDEESSVDFDFKKNNCSTASGIDFDFYGEKTIGEDILKYEKTLVSDGSGDVELDDVEWDTYHLDITDPTYFLAGSNPFLPLSVSPGAEYELDVVVESQDPNALLVRVIDGNEGIPVADATVELSEGEFSEIQLTGQGSMSQTDWSGGGGQENIGNLSAYFAQDGNIDVSSFPGELRLGQFSGQYFSSGELTSSTFDIGDTTNFLVINWKPQSQLAETGEDSVRFQIATNEDLDGEVVWSYKGPDGTSGTYYTTSGEPIHTSHNGHQFLRYKMFLSTEDTSVTPIISDMSFSFASGCAPSGQVYFDGLASDTYDIDVTKSGYINFSSNNIPVTDPWQVIDVILELDE
jgi:hypothetical protein